MPAWFYILSGGLLAGVASLALGRIFLSVMRVELHREEERIFGFATGAALLSLIVFLLASAGQARKSVFVSVGVAAIAIAFRRGLHRSSSPTLPPLGRKWAWIFWLVFAPFTVLYFFNAMAPEVSPDGATYHLGLVGRYARDLGFRRLTTNMYANLSQGAEMLFLYAYSIGRHSAAGLTHFWFLFTLPFAMLAYARRFGFAAAGAAAALFVYCSPVVGIDGISAYNDVAVACVLFTLFYTLQVWDETRQKGLLIAAGLLAGFAYAIKYTAFLAVPYALGFVAWRSWRRRESIGRPVLAVALATLPLIAPWMLKNALWVDNPFSPFLNRWFPNPYIHASFEEMYSYHMRHYPGIKDYSQIPLEVTLRGELLCGFLGPLFLITPVGLLAARRQPGRRLLFAGLLFGATYFANIGTRFLIPAAPFVALALGLAVSRMPGAMVTLVAFHALTSWPDAASLYCSQYAWRLEKIMLPQAFRIKSEEYFLSTRVPGYDIARLIELKVPPGKKVVTFTQVAEAYATRDVTVCYQSAAGEELADILQMPLVPDRQPVGRLAFRFTKQKLRKVRAVQTAGPDIDHWNIHEFRVYREGKFLDRAPAWRLRAHPNPWGVVNAFDNARVTRWSSFQKQFPGMYVEVDFGKEEDVDAVVLECGRDQYKVKVRLEAEDARGKVVRLAEAPEDKDAAPPLGLRREAVLEVKLRGYDYLVMHEGDLGAEDFLKNALLWGVTNLGERRGFRLYRLN
jgi:hypothetical protein